MVNTLIVRNDHWLETRLRQIWQRYFYDVKPQNIVLIKFGQRSRTRLGSIGMEGWQAKAKSGMYKSRLSVPLGTSIITITGYFRQTTIPEYVIDATIGHELVHYVHGFHSPYPQLYRYPHQGGIVDKEMRERGMGEMLRLQKQWLKEQWRTVAPPIRRKRRRYGRLSFL